MLRRRPPRPPYDPALPLLRRRAGRLLTLFSAKARAFVRLLPLLLEARFRRPSLDGDPPGLVQPPRRRRWGRLCEQLELPPPLSFSKHRPLVESVVLAPNAAGGLELLVIPLTGLYPAELERLSARVEAIVQLAERHAPDVDVRLAGPAELSEAQFAWAAVVAGDVPTLPDLAALDWHDAFARAPSPLLRCLMLLVPGDGPAPMQLLRTTHVPSSALGFVASWSGHPVARAVAALDGKTLSPVELEGLARQLRTAALQALRRFPVRERKSLRAVLRAALFARRVPPVLRPHLERALQGRTVKETQVADGWQLTVDGVVFAAASSLEQLRVRALAESPLLVAHAPSPMAQRLAHALAAGAPRALVQLEAGTTRHLVVVVPAVGRPRARRVDVPRLLELILTWHRAGAPVELIPAPGCEPPLLARCSQLLATRLKPGEPVAFQLGRRVLLIGAHGLRRLPLDKALLRPRRLTWVPEQADMLRALRRPLATGLPTVQVVAFPDDAAHAALFALDAQGRVYRERVALEELEATLQELREVLRHGDPPSLLSATVHPLLTSLSGRLSDPSPTLLVTVSLTEHGDQALFDEERFGAGTELPWSALAEAVLSRWPPGTWGHVGVARVMAPSGTAGLELLAARSRVLRRVHTHLRRIARSLRAA